MGVVCEPKYGLFQYHIAVYNAGSAKDPVRHVKLMWNWDDVGGVAPEFAALRTNNTNWKALDHSWKGTLRPGDKVNFSIVSSLSPDKAFVVVSGVDANERHEETSRIIERGATLDFVEHMIKVTEEAENPRFTAVK